MLWLALLVRSTKRPASEYLKVRNESAALDFDLAVAQRLFRLERDERKDLAQRIAYEVSRTLFGGKDEEPEAENVHPLVAANRFADKDTEVW